MPESSQTDKKKWTARDVLRTLCRHRVLFAVGTALFAVPTLLLAHRIPQFEKKYTGTAKFERRSDAAAPQQRRDPAESFEQIKLTLTHELKGRRAIEEAVAELGLDKGLPRNEEGQLTDEGRIARQKLVKRLSDEVKVNWDVRSERVDLVSVTFTDKDPELARQLPNTLVRNYINETSEQMVERLTASRDFLQKQVEDVEKRLAAANKRLIKFEESHGGMLPNSPGALQDRMREVASDIDSVRRQQTAARQRLERLKAMGQHDPDEPVETVKGPNPELARLNEKLRERERELRAHEEALQDYYILGHMKDKHPKVQSLKKKIETTEEKIAEIEKEIEETDETTVLQEVYSDERQRKELAIALAAAQSEYDMLTGELDRLQKRLDDLQTLLANYAPVREEYMRILMPINDLEAEKRNWQQRLSAVEMALSAEVAKRRTHLNAIQLAEKQFQPSSPKLHHLLGFALVGGLVFGGALVFLASWRDRSVWTPQDAERAFGLPVCGVIGEIVPPTTRVWRSVRRFVVEPVGALLLVTAIGVGAMHVLLWLRMPEQFQQWADAPAAFLSENLWPMIQRAI